MVIYFYVLINQYWHQTTSFLLAHYLNDPFMDEPLCFVHFIITLTCFQNKKGCFCFSKYFEQTATWDTPVFLQPSSFSRHLYWPVGVWLNQTITTQREKNNSDEFLWCLDRSRGGSNSGNKQEFQFFIQCWEAAFIQLVISLSLGYRILKISPASEWS